ncbi:MAG: hypothetical protein PHU63_04345 [Candidatus ainarchaeum sp.]|nr:hypothetical protein [Candidatus ainarchaeum sp.]
MYKTKIHPRVIRVCKPELPRYLDRLERIMKREFPKDEQLSRRQITERVLHVTRKDKETFVVAYEENDEILGMAIFSTFRAGTQSISLIEYMGVLDDNKSRGIGTFMLDQIFQIGGEFVLETEMVPRLVENAVHSQDVPKAYLQTNQGIVLNGRVTPKRWEGILKRNRFWERNGFGILEPLAYCQPGLDAEDPVKERVPLDLQLRSKKEVLTVDEIRARLRLVALNYESVINTKEFVEMSLAFHRTNCGCIRTVPFSEVLETDMHLNAMGVIELK